MMKKVLGWIFNRLTIVIMLLVVQLAVLFVLVWKLSQSFTYVYVLFLLISIFVFFDILRNDMNANFKLSWCIIIAILPLFGGLFYLCCVKIQTPKATRERQAAVNKQFEDVYPKNESDFKALRQENGNVYGQSRYIQNITNMPIYSHTKTKFYPLGEAFFEDLLVELQAAERYIFLEYFILAEGTMWSRILEILKQKAAEGVDVRVMYDDVGSINLVPTGYAKQLAQFRIKALAFNPFVPALSVFLQNRDHRKIAVIDGHTAFTGGINIGDEYINAYEKHGHWKDTAVRLKGKGAYSFALLFLQSWNYFQAEDGDLSRFQQEYASMQAPDSAGYVQPYNDSPYDHQDIAKNVYLNIFNMAQKTLYINTPYLIVENEVIDALILAAQRGVDVRIATPGVADKPYVHFTTRSYYAQLIRGGVKIYEYTPGFLHAKTVFSDDCVGTVGTVNMDYRSLYHHFECGVLMYQTEALPEMKEDFLKTLSVCKAIGEEFCMKRGIFYKIGQSLMRIVAPLF